MQVIENYIKVYLDLNSNIEIHKLRIKSNLEEKTKAFKF